MSPCFYWINLDKDVGRRLEMEKLFLTTGYKNEKIQGIMVGASQEERELGCTLSHVKAIHQFLKSKDGWAVICEDDLSLDYRKYWKTDINGVVDNAPNDWEIIQIAINVGSNTINKFYTAATDYLPHTKGHHSTVCYIINRIGAEKIVNTVTAGVADHALYNTAKSYTYRYPMFTYNTESSNIHPKNLAVHAKSKLRVQEFLENVKCY